jgi:hypothetical protein
MKTVAKNILNFLLPSLTTPTIVTVIEKSSIFLFFNMSEEEHFHKEIIAAVSLEHFLHVHSISLSRSYFREVIQT